MDPRPAPVLSGPIIAGNLSPNTQAYGPNPNVHYGFGSSPIFPYKFLHLGTISKWNTASRHFFIASDKIFSELPKFLGQLYSRRLLSRDFHFLLHANASLLVTTVTKVVYYFVLISPHYFYSFPVTLFKITRSLLTLSLSKSKEPELNHSISSFLYLYWCFSGMKPKYGVRTVSSFLVLSAYFSCSETETVAFPDRSQTCFHGQEDQGAGCFPCRQWNTCTEG